MGMCVNPMSQIPDDKKTESGSSVPGLSETPSLFVPFSKLNIADSKAGLKILLKNT